MPSLLDGYDCLLLDLDGTVYRGGEPTPGAVDVLGGIAGSVSTLFVTNNASRSAAEVAEHLRRLGFGATDRDVVTSAQSAAALLAGDLDDGAAVLIVGTESLAGEIRGVGLRPVHSADDEPVAVVQGHSPDTCWADLAEAALAIRAGARWVAANVDATLPTERGLLPGNGSMVAALRLATGAEPEVAGKPAPTLLRDALARGDFDRPLVVGDRLDTDIAGANAAELPSLMVLTGVSTAADLVFAADGERPDYLGADLRALYDDPDRLRIGPRPAWQVDDAGDGLVVTATAAATDDPLDVVRTVAAAVWARGTAPTVRAGDDAAADALAHWSLAEVG